MLKYKLLVFFGWMGLATAFAQLDTYSYTQELN